MSSGPNKSIFGAAYDKGIYARNYVKDKMPFDDDSNKETAVNVLTLAALAAGVYGVYRLGSNKKVKSFTRKLSDRVSMNMFGKHKRKSKKSRKSRKGSRKVRKTRRSRH